MALKKLPQNLEAEASVLGGVLLRNEVMAELGQLDSRDFFNPRNQAVWDACRAIFARQEPIDEVTLQAELDRMGRLNAVGGLAYVARLVNYVPTSARTMHYAAIVRELAAIRRLMIGLSQVVQEGYEGKASAELVAGAHDVLRGFETSSSHFVSAAERVQGEAERRRELVARELAFNVSFLDDYLRGILPNDLIILGAYTGAGKTQLAQLIAQSNAQQGKRIYMFALEAEPDEIERRTKFAVLAQLVYRAGAPGRAWLNYPDWYRGKCDRIVEPFENAAQRWLETNLATLHTLYRGRDFTVDHIEQHIRAIGDRADLIILDHLHYVDSDDPNENRAVKAIIKRIRDVNLAFSVPVLVVAHLRKKDRIRRPLVPDGDDFHGASDITKIATAAIMLSRARDRESVHPWLAHTYMQVVKSRMGGQCPYIAMIGYDLRRNVYEERYELGRLNLAGDAVEMLSREKYPRWAIHGRDSA